MLIPNTNRAGVYVSIEDGLELFARMTKPTMYNLSKRENLMERTSAPSYAFSYFLFLLLFFFLLLLLLLLNIPQTGSEYENTQKIETQKKR